ncbi:PREDICTED: malonyl-CoA:anthocyanidin 5-O-glucoside-6''-O-malonyltransferase-like [Prunus mume]|uniref:Malonyl-CoA:anthocyanidin 5-O-glucoside-6''-O-malonyltransferase-like n=1 Tax=Prunus mume TaxID=102107 RepID=A0ABM0NWV1_PRUMU|nr:PREDICTED: malonyl-CoA:anthocyanidin 5-O-glucoside-6''-O-malonyltransferase-like [Prunus mume]
MAAPNSVKVVEVCKVAPPPSSPACSATPPPEALPLTVFDLLWLRFAPVQRLFFYQISSNSFDTTTLVSKLKASLSIALQQFLPLAGNLTWPQDSPKPTLSYVQGDAVSLTISTSQSADHFDHISSNNLDVEAKEYHPLIPQLAFSQEKAAAMALQVTTFPNRGFSIGIATHHAILDGKTSTMFMKSWAHICKHVDDDPSSLVLPDQLKPFFDRRVIGDPAGLEAIYYDEFLSMDGRSNNRSLMPSKFRAPAPDSIRGTFVFTRPKIEALRLLVKEKNHQHEYQSVQKYLSTFCITCAYTWVCLVKAEEIQGGKAFMGFTVDCRSRLDPPISSNYFGNCLVIRLVVAETKALLGEDGLTVAVNAICEAVKSLDDGVLSGAENWIKPLYSVGGDEKMLSVAGSPRFEVYETDFGWGRPNKVEIVSIEGTGAMSMSESKDGAGGVDVGLVLEKNSMQVFATLFAEGLANL